MTEQEILALMQLPKDRKYLQEYKIIYKLATAKDYNGCMCLDGLNNLYHIASTYAEKLKLKSVENENK